MGISGQCMEGMGAVACADLAKGLGGVGKRGGLGGEEGD